MDERFLKVLRGRQMAHAMTLGIEAEESIVIPLLAEIEREGSDVDLYLMLYQLPVSPYPGS